MFRIGMSRLLVALIVVSLSLPALTGMAAQPAAAQMSPDLLVYHQITDLAGVTGSVGFPVLSADGTRAIFTDAPGSQDPATPNRIYVVGADGNGLMEVDSYEPHCFCGSWVDISDDGDTFVSTDSMQLRIGRVGSEAETILDLTSNEMSSIRLTAAGDRIFFLLARDTALASPSTDTLQRGIYVVDADGGGLRQVVGPQQVADLLGLAPDAVQMLRLQINALDVSSDGTHAIFGAYAGPETAVFAYDDGARDLRLLRGSLAFVQRVAISGDGATVAYDVVPPEPPSDNEISVAGFDAPEPDLMATRTYSGFDDPMQLSDDGSQLLISPNSLLIDTDTGNTRLLAASIPGVGGNHEAVLTDGLARATMNAEATRFLYAIRTVRCADCVNLPEQLATLDLGPADSGDAPAITETSIEPESIPLNYESAATVRASVDATGEVLGVGVIALRDGRLDVNVANGATLHDDGQHGDTTANDGVYGSNEIVHVAVEARDNDIGPRTMRVAAEAKSSDGLRHATAVDIGQFMVGDTAAASGGSAG